jgi:hypothetical protein
MNFFLFRYPRARFLASWTLELIPSRIPLDLVQTLISGLQLPNFIFNCVKFFAESPAFDCKICSLASESKFEQALSDTGLDVVEDSRPVRFDGVGSLDEGHYAAYAC